MINFFNDLLHLIADVFSMPLVDGVTGTEIIFAGAFICLCYWFIGMPVKLVSRHRNNDKEKEVTDSDEAKKD